MTVMSTTMTVATMDGCLALDFGSIPRVVCAASHQRLLPVALAAVVTSKTTVPKARQWLLLATLVAVAMSEVTVSKDTLAAAADQTVEWLWRYFAVCLVAECLVLLVSSTVMPLGVRHVSYVFCLLRVRLLSGEYFFSSLCSS